MATGSSSSSQGACSPLSPISVSLTDLDSLMHRQYNPKCSSLVSSTMVSELPCLGSRSLRFWIKKVNPTLTVTLIPKSKSKEKDRELTDDASGSPEKCAAISAAPFLSIRRASACRGVGRRTGQWKGNASATAERENSFGGKGRTTVPRKNQNREGRAAVEAFTPSRARELDVLCAGTEARKRSATPPAGHRGRRRMRRRRASHGRARPLIRLKRIYNF
jgi:hypothetical protein